MKVKCLEIRDRATFLSVICVHPAPDNEAQRWLLRQDGYSGSNTESCIIMIDHQCRGVHYDPFDWVDRTKQVAHKWIRANWDQIADGDVVDVEFILGESTTKKTSERFGG